MAVITYDVLSSPVFFMKVKHLNFETEYSV